MKCLTEILVFLLIATVLVLLIWPYATEIIPTGHVGVFYRIFGGTVLDRSYGEGLHFFLPWNKMFVYDCRIIRNDFEVTALSQGGLQVRVDLSAVYHVKKEEAPGLHLRIGQDYAQKLIVPGAVFAIHGIVGNLHQSDIYNNDPIAIQDKVFALLDEVLKQEDTAIVLHGIFVRKIELPPQMAAAIEAKHEAEQLVYQERYKILQAYERYKRIFLEASTVRMTQRLINEGMTEEYLRYKGIEATRDLSASPNAKLVIVGGKDGLPLILNPDSLHTGPPDPAGAGPGSRPGDITGPGGIPPFEMPALSDLEENLKELDDILQGANGDINGDITESPLMTLPEKLLETNGFFSNSTDMTGETDATPLQENKPQ